MDYKEKLRLAKEALESGSYDRETIEYIFPELAESEDERIRKELLNAFKEATDSLYMVLTPFKRKAFIAWLEKQGDDKVELKPVNIVTILNDYFANTPKEKQDKDWEDLKHLNNFGWELVKQNPADTNNNFIRMRENKPKDIAEFLDRLTTVEQEFLWEHIAKIRELDKEEQKPADKIEPRFKVGDTMRTLQEAADGFTDGMPVVVSIDDKYYRCNNELIAIKDQDDYEYPPMNRKQKPAEWSEEDEDMLYKAIAVINRLCAENEEYVWSINTLKNLFYWLKSLKDRVQPQPKQEWSEDDENRLNHIIQFLEDKDRWKDTERAFPIEEDVRWLKSLRPQSTWKPSDKQLVALRVAIGDEQGSDCCDTLRSLLKDLKSL